MKKLKKIIAAALLVVGCTTLGHSATTRYAEIRTNGTLQPDTTNYGIHTGSGTVDNFRATQSTITTLTAVNESVTASTTTRQNVTSFVTNTATGTTLTFSTGTIGSFTANSSTVAITSIASGTVSNLTVSGSATFSNKVLSNISSGTVAGDATRYSQNKMLQSVDNSVSAASSTISATYGKTNITVTITVLNAASKVNLMASFTASNSAVQNNCEYKITKNGNAITNTNTVGFGSSGVATGSLQYGMFLIGSDLPGASGSTTYEVSFRNLSGGITCTTGGSTTPAMIRADEINGL